MSTYFRIRQYIYVNTNNKCSIYDANRNKIAEFDGFGNNGYAAQWHPALIITDNSNLEQVQHYEVQFTSEGATLHQLANNEVIP